MTMTKDMITNEAAVSENQTHSSSGPPSAKNAGRWKILRDAILSAKEESNVSSTSSNDQSSRSSSSNNNASSIHRFEGYNLLSPITVHEAKNGDTDDGDIYGEMESLLTSFRWNDHDDVDRNLDRLEVAVLAVAAYYSPKGKCITVSKTSSNFKHCGTGCVSASDNTTAPPSATPTLSSVDWFTKLKERLHNNDDCASTKLQPPSVFVIKIDEKMTAAATVETTIRVHASSDRHCTRYCVKRYDLHKQMIPTVTSMTKSTDLIPQPIPLSLFTREPRHTRLRLSDLVTHRYNDGVDNTGNICVWDSERTLSYLLFHHWNDFGVFDEQIQRHESTTSGQCRYSVLELGTGMAGLSAVALGIRIVTLIKATAPVGENEKIVDVTLTDGNPTGVMNNMINQYLTSTHAFAQQQQHQTDTPNNIINSTTESTYHHPYCGLNVSCRKLLWTTDLDEDTASDDRKKYDVVLISDCTHFQDFHAALAVTTLRFLTVGGSAIFCQPSRGKSLDNFCEMIESPSKTEPLVSTRWFPQSHHVLKDKHLDALRKHADTDVYDESLHRPRIWIVTKLREITKDDQHRFVSILEARSMSKPETVEQF